MTTAELATATMTELIQEHIRIDHAMGLGPEGAVMTHERLRGLLRERNAVKAEIERRKVAANN